jgi:SAM-dependent methyltransferase
VFNYIQEHGRTYNGYGERTYVLPNDDMELDRLDLQHHLLKMTFGNKLAVCEPDKNKILHNVLDLGTGTGILSIEFGDEHPESIVLGVDVSPVQPTFVPTNVKFEIMDIGQPWSFGYHFDFIFCRFMTGAIANWRALIQECYE